MTERNLCVTAKDEQRLRELLAVAGPSLHRDRNDLKALETELKRARIVDPKAIPPTVVTMNTRLRLRDLDTLQVAEMTVVFPGDADADAGRISVVSPVGMALLGYAEGDTVEWSVPAGKRRLLIEQVVYQPEASGDYHL